MATVDSTVTAIINVKRSWCFSRGSTADMANAADAPQMATAPPDSTLKPVPGNRATSAWARALTWRGGPARPGHG
jgi:hypothetical protein